MGKSERDIHKHDGRSVSTYEYTEEGIDEGRNMEKDRGEKSDKSKRAGQEKKKELQREYKQKE